MTCIVVARQEDKMFMAGDRGASENNMILSLTSPKVWKHGEYLFGYCGSMDGDRMKHNFKPPTPKGDLDKFMYTDFLIALRVFYENWWVDVSNESDFGLVIAIRGKIYEHNAVDMSLNQYMHDYIAMGSGAEYAYGYMHATENLKDTRKRVTGAVGAAIKFSTSCQGPVDIVSI
jgi:ATP-dependent protease HslVU (ClpYQ) peptidase subunit